MSAAVLVLDISYQPHRVVSWQDAMCDLVLGKIEVVEYSKDKTIRSASRTWPMPSVVRILHSFKRDKLRTKFSRINIYVRDNFTCQFCGQKFMTEDLTFDHVTPRAQGGKTTWENVTTCCITCNRKKADRTPTQAGMKLLSVPKKPHYLPAIMVRMGKDTPLEWKNYWRTELTEK